MAAVEEVCLRLPTKLAVGLRADTNGLLNKNHPKPNITLQEFWVLEELERDQSRIILTMDKEVAMVIMDGQEYVSKVQELLSDQDT